MPIQVECRNCGKAFSCAPSQQRQFCSIVCRTKHRRAAGGWETRTCKNCGNDFQIAGGRIAQGGGAYCSDQCRVEHKAIVPRVCPTCGETFLSRHPNPYCSKPCAGVARRTRQPRTCKTCGTGFFEEPSRIAQGKGTYCSKACAFPGLIDRSCEKCGAAFTASRSEIAKGWGRFCSNECRRTRSARTCVTCGGPFEAVQSVIDADGGKYCSVECRGLARRNRVKRDCVVCGTPFERPASTVARTAAIFCSRACMTVAQREDEVAHERVRQMQRDQLARREPTRAERALYVLLDQELGEGEWSREYLVFDKWTVDAAVPGRRLIFQADGDYWHGWDPKWRTHPIVAKNLVNDRRQDAYIAKTDWTSLRLWEHDLLQRPDWCTEQIRAAIAAGSATVYT